MIKIVSRNKPLKNKKKSKGKKGNKNTKSNSKTSFEISEQIVEISELLKKFNYITNDDLALLIFMAMKLNKPILIEGPPGTGKTELANVMSNALKRPLIRLQCYEGIDESRILYEWDYAKQILTTQIIKSSSEINKEKENNHKDLLGINTDLFFTEEFLVERPVLRAFRSKTPVVFLIDEIDKADREIEAMLLEVLSERQISIPEIGTIKADSFPLTIITSNDTRELTDALRRRCLFYNTKYPSFETELEIVCKKNPDIEKKLAEKSVKIVQSLRTFQLNKLPSISETLDWIKALYLMNAKYLDSETFIPMLNILLKNKEDLQFVRSNLNKLFPEEFSKDVKNKILIGE